VGVAVDGVDGNGVADANAPYVRELTISARVPNADRRILELDTRCVGDRGRANMDCLRALTMHALSQVRQQWRQRTLAATVAMSSVRRLQISQRCGVTSRPTLVINPQEHSRKLVHSILRLGDHS
jgi:hypothetical protein